MKSLLHILGHYGMHKIAYVTYGVKIRKKGNIMTFCYASTVEGESERVRKKYRLFRMYVYFTF
jgi:hypothetical protein